MKLATNLFLSSLTLAVSFGLTGCGAEKVAVPEAAEEAMSEKGADAATGDTLRIATEGAYPPMNFTNADGTLAGFDVDITNALCEQMKAKCEIVAQGWDGIIPGLEANKYDAIVAGMSITDERKKAVDFTDPYFSSGLILIAKADSDITFDTIEDKKVGAQKGTIAAEYVEEKNPKAEVKTYDTQEAVNSDLVSGRVDAVLVDQVVGTDWLTSDKAAGFSQKGGSISTGKDDMGIAVRKGDELAGKFNTALAEIKANGTYEKVSIKYFSNGESK